MKTSEHTPAPRSEKYPRLTAGGAEIPDPKPLVAFMKINPETGEVVREGRSRPRSIEEMLRLSQVRTDMGYDALDENDWDDIDENDGGIPVLSPLQEGFVDSLAPSETRAIKTLIKKGVLPPDFLSEPSPEPPASPRRGARPSKAGAPADAPEPESGEGA